MGTLYPGTLCTVGSKSSLEFLRLSLVTTLVRVQCRVLLEGLTEGKVQVLGTFGRLGSARTTLEGKEGFHRARGTLRWDYDNLDPLLRAVYAP